MFAFLLSRKFTTFMIKTGDSTILVNVKITTLTERTVLHEILMAVPH